MEPIRLRKELGFSGKKDIEAYGIAVFNKKCRESVFTYIDEWSKFTKRIGLWVDETKAYFTFDKFLSWKCSGISSRRREKDDRLYKDYQVLPWSRAVTRRLSLARGRAGI